MTTTAKAPTEVMQLQPYIFFYGRCEEALEFYKKALGGAYEVLYVKDSPVADQMPTDFRDKVMHASFTAPGIAFLASDGREAKAIDPEAGNISLALSVTDSAQGERLFKALS
ncbi:MAG: VOC family protein, partial [Vulcanimicrobiaceae bacterium]